MKGERSNPSGAPLSASARLKAHRDRIVELWAERVRQSLPAAKSQHEPQLRDSLPEFLDLLALALSPEGLPPRSSDALSDVSQEHGTQRSRFEGYSLQRLLREYQLLREVLFGVLEREAPLTPRERDTLLSAIDQAMAEAGERFMQAVQSHGKDEVRDSGEAAKKELEEIFLQAPAPFVVMSGPEHRFTLANPPYERLVNRKVLGKTVQEAFTEEGALQTLSVIDKVYRTGEPHISKELPIALPDEHGNAREHYLNVSFTALRDSQGRISAVTGLILDVTEQVRARQEVTRVLDSVPQIIWMTNAQGDIQFLSRQWLEFTGLDPSDGGLGRQFEQVMHPDDVAANVRAVQDAQKRRGPVSLVHRIRAPDGEYRWVLARGNPTFSDSGELTGWIGVTIDMHEQRLVQEELARAVEHLQEERELRERFVATLTHDLRTPLTAAKMGTHLLMRRGDDPVVLTKTAGRIADNIDRADRMIRDLLDANRITAGETLPAELARCDLTAIARETLEELAQVHGDRFVLSAPDIIEGYWSCSALRRILENLCNNAIKYGARDRAVTVALTRRGPEEVLLSVHNWGPPIPLEDQPSLFEPYRRMKSAQTGKEKGWGLGLTLVRGLAQAHQGTVQVESTEASGTTFTVMLPSDSRPRT
ncbi:MAG TPA: ATP-binding protein [Archangium sp.]|nr:ATP-binding protein [Archangium sp.]